MSALRARFGRAASSLLLPLSLVPFAVVGPNIVDSYRNFERRQNSAPHPAPQIELTAAQTKRLTRVAPFRGAIPVLAYHGIGSSNDGYSVSRRAFAEQIAALHHMGFRTISVDRYVRFRRGELGGLPSRPILITFDDGRLDSYRGADRTLARFGFRATMFVITHRAERKDPFYLSWRELHAMADSRRWDPMRTKGTPGWL